jgi:hypothetical protein
MRWWSGPKRQANQEKRGDYEGQAGKDKRGAGLLVTNTAVAWPLMIGQATANGLRSGDRRRSLIWVRNQRIGISWWHVFLEGQQQRRGNEDRRIRP